MKRKSIHSEPSKPSKKALELEKLYTELGFAPGNNPNPRHDFSKPFKFPSRYKSVKLTYTTFTK